MRCLVSGALLLAMTASGVALDQGAWFPAGAREAMARDLAPRLDHIQVGIDQADLLTTARRTVLEMGLRLDTLGHDKLMALAPRFERLELPMNGQPHLDAMARLGTCVYYLEARYANLDGLDESARIDAAIGPMTLALATMFLRDAYLKGGGSDDAIRTYLAGDALNAVAMRIPRDPELLAYTAGECRAVVSALLD